MPAYWIALALGTHWPRLALGQGGGDGLLELDKALHVVAFFGLTALLHAALPRTGGHAAPSAGGEGPRRVTLSKWLASITALGVAVGYAAVDEITQRWTGREVHLDDFVASGMGCGLAFLAFTPRPRPGGGRLFLAWSARALAAVLLPVAMYFALSPDAQEALLRLYNWIDVSPMAGDKLAHSRVAGGLTLLLAASAWLGMKLRGLAAVITGLAMLGSARSIEWMQIQTGRADFADPRDIAAHEHGVVWAIAIWVALVALRPALPAVGRAMLVILGFPGRSQATGGEDAEKQGRFVGHAAVVSGLTLVSRFSGLLRDAVLARFLGLSAATDAFFIGFLVPNLFRRLFGEGALASAFIPQYARLRESDPALAKRFVTATLACLAALLSAITLLAVAALWAASTWGQWSDRTELAIALTMLMLPYMPMVCLVAMLGGVLQVHRRFAPAAAAPIVLNAVMIAACLWAGLRVGASEGGAGEAGATIAAATGVGVLIAGAGQLLWLALAVRGTAGPSRRVTGTGEPLKKMLRVMGPMVLGLAVYQVNALFDSLLAFGLSAPPGGEGTFTALGRTVAYPMQSGDVAALQWAQRLYQFPLGVFGIAIATAIFPALAAAAGREERSDRDAMGGDETGSFRGILRRGLALTVLIGLPAAVGLVLVREPLVSVVFERGAFAAGDVPRVATILVGYAVGIWAFTSTHVLTRGFYARQDSTTPVKIAVAMVALNLALNVTLIWPLGAAGLAWSTAISGIIHAGTLAVVLHRRVGQLVNAALLGSWARSAAATLLMIAVAWPVANWATPRYAALGVL
ncbi:MAG: murein biosynthesis integral membrane protein MurJ, partial [Phycisphaeraceae bacterium]